MFLEFFDISFSRERVDSTKEFAIDIFENEVRTAGGKWVHAETPYTSENGFPLEHKDDIKLPGEWTEWTVVENNCDEEGNDLLFICLLDSKFMPLSYSNAWL